MSLGGYVKPVTMRKQREVLEILSISDSVLESLIVGLSVLLAVLAVFVQIVTTRNREDELRDVKRAFERAADEVLGARLRNRPLALTAEERKEILDALTSGLPPTEDIEAKLEKRLAELEDRLPADATLDKVASVNDAILATKLEAVEESLKQLRNSTLSRWDVVIVVFAILAALGGLLGIINYVSD
jgi:hypothetical protein